MGTTADMGGWTAGEVGARRLLRPCSLKRLLCLLALILVNSGKSHGDRQGQELAHPGRSPIPLRAHIAVGAVSQSAPLAGQGSPRGLFGLADFAKSLRFANSISHALSHPPSSSAWAAFALSAPRVARTLLGAFAGPTQGRTLYCPVTAVHLPTRRIYPSAGSIRWIYPLDLSVGSIRWIYPLVGSCPPVQPVVIGTFYHSNQPSWRCGGLD